MSVTPEAVPAQICAGIDWAKDDHAIAIIGLDGEILDRFAVDHDAAGLKALVRRLLKAGVNEVGIERGDGPVVEALLQSELTVLVIAPGQLKNLRSLRVGRHQGRPVRRLRPGRRGPHRPSTVAGGLTPFLGHAESRTHDGQGVSEIIQESWPVRTTPHQAPGVDHQDRQRPRPTASRRGRLAPPHPLHRRRHPAGSLGPCPRRRPSPRR